MPPFRRELADHFLDAKIVLPLRDPEAPKARMERTILKVTRELTTTDGLATRLIKDRVLGGNLDDRDHTLSVNDRNTRDVQSAVGLDRFLIFELGVPCEPLCNLLIAAAPDVAQPSGNERDASHQILDRLQTERIRKDNAWAPSAPRLAASGRKNASTDESVLAKRGQGAYPTSSSTNPPESG